jgi:AraC-like DNA-binding protein
LENGDSGLAIQASFLWCLSLFLQHCTSRRLPSGRFACHRVKHARDYIHTNFSRHISLDELSRASGLSRFHLVHAFVAVYGLPPHAYQNSLRIAKAREMLAAGESAADLAALLGFADQSHFTRHFRTMANVTPVQYARMVRGIRAPDSPPPGPASRSTAPLHPKSERPRAQ